jgi:serine/threonine protein kinase
VSQPIGDDVTRTSSGGDETVAAGAVRPAGSDEITVLSGSGREGSTRAPHLEPGQVFGSYRIERVLGRGGMGEVYEAEHVEHARRVALKILGARLAGAEEREQFLREGATAASINHPHTVYVYGSEELAGAPVIAMELVAGGTLRDRVLAKGALAPPEAVDLILQVISGLAAAERPASSTATSSPPTVSSMATAS